MMIGDGDDGEADGEDGYKHEEGAERLTTTSPCPPPIPNAIHLPPSSSSPQFRSRFGSSGLCLSVALALRRTASTPRTLP
eukprot:1065175-Pyramimonas_sp.AAC.2